MWIYICTYVNAFRFTIVWIFIQKQMAEILSIGRLHIRLQKCIYTQMHIYIYAINHKPDIDLTLRTPLIYLIFPRFDTFILFLNIYTYKAIPMGRLIS